MFLVWSFDNHGVWYLMGQPNQHGSRWSSEENEAKAFDTYSAAERAAGWFQLDCAKVGTFIHKGI